MVSEQWDTYTRIPLFPKPYIAVRETSSSDSRRRRKLIPLTKLLSSDPTHRLLSGILQRVRV